MLATYLPFLQYLPSDPLDTKSIIKSVSKMEEHFSRELQEHKESFEENNMRDVFDRLIYHQYNETGHDKFFTGECFLLIKL